MKFRILKYYDRYQAQICDEVLNGLKWQNKWINIGSPTGYATVDEARNYCKLHKATLDDRVVEEFEL